MPFRFLTFTGQNAMNYKKNLTQCIVAFLLAQTPTLDASISGVVRDISMKGSNVATIHQDTKGGIFIQTSTDKGHTWSPPVNIGNPSSNFMPKIIVGGPLGNIFFCAFPPSLFHSAFLGYTSDPGNASNAGVSGTNTSVYGLQAVQDEVFLLNSSNYQFFPYPGIILYTLVNVGNGTNLSPLNSPNNLHNYAGTAVPSLLAASTTTNPPSVLCVTWQPNPHPNNILFQKVNGNWLPTGLQNQIPEFHKLTTATSPMQLVGLEDLSAAALITLNNGNLYTFLCTNPLEATWAANPIQLETADQLTILGGLNFDPSTHALQTLCSTKSGKLLQVIGSMETGLTNVIPRGDTLPTIHQISPSASRSAFGWWLVLTDGKKGKNLYLLRGRGLPEVELAGFLLVENLTKVTDHNISMAVTVDVVTGDVVAIFDISSPNPEFSFNVTPIIPPELENGGPGTYVCTIAGGVLQSAEIRKIAEPMPK